MPGFLKSKKNIFLPSFVLIVGLALSLTGAFAVKNFKLNELFQRHKIQETANLEHARQRLEETFSLSYEAIRTMAMLPGVTGLRSQGKHFSDESIVSIQQLYNNVAAHVVVSEIYISAVDFDPDQKDPQTGRLKEPLITFDHIIAGARADKKNPTAVHEEIEEVEIFEYREMKKQIAWFREHHPRRETVEGLNYPALISSEVITCDNTEFSQAALNAGDNRPRNGLIYSVPFYGHGGDLKGIVSAVLRTQALQATLNLPGASLEAETEKFRVGPAFTPEGQKQFAIFQKVNVKINDAVAWNLSYLVPEEKFLNAENQKLIALDFWFVLAAGIAVSVLLTWGVTLLNSVRLRAQALAEEMTLVAQTRQAALLSSAKMASLGEMASGIAHEINNPLAIILGRLDMMTRKLQSPDFAPSELQKDFDRLRTTALRIDKIIKGLRNLSRNADHDPLIETPVKEIIADTLEFCSQRFQHRGVDLQLTPMPDISVLARGTQISQVLLNLLNNAMDATESLSERWVRIELLEGTNQLLQICVTDSGAGIPPEVAANLAKPFFTTKEPGKGTGLGLSISRKIAQEHGGRLFLDSSTKNTRFVMELRIAPAKSLAA